MLTITLTSVFLLSGYYISIPQGDSMNPVISEGDVVILSSNIDSIENGDIVHYNSTCTDEERIHTVVSQPTDDEYFTSGFNNSYVDQFSNCDLGNIPVSEAPSNTVDTDAEPITNSEINGKVVRTYTIPLVSYVI